MRGARRERGPEGELIPLTRQDRALWDRGEIAEGVALLTATLPKGAVGPYQLQAAIAAVHDEADEAEADRLAADSGAVRSVETHVRQPDGEAESRDRRGHGARSTAGLELLDGLDADGGLKGHHRLDAVRAHLLELAGERDAAVANYLAAAERSTSLPERNYLMTQAARLRES